MNMNFLKELIKMKIKKITRRNRRDFTAIMICEHCDHIFENKYGYDDTYYHSKIIPKMKCNKCGKISPDNYIPNTPKYNQNEII